MCQCVNTSCEKCCLSVAPLSMKLYTSEAVSHAVVLLQVKNPNNGIGINCDWSENQNLIYFACT